MLLPPVTDGLTFRATRSSLAGFCGVSFSGPNDRKSQSSPGGANIGSVRASDGQAMAAEVMEFAGPEWSMEPCRE